MTDRMRGAAEMTAAMAIAGSIGWVVVRSGRPVIDLVFWRCAFGAAALLIVCAVLGLFRGTLTPRILAFAALGGVAIVLNWLLLFASFSRASISIATAVYSTQPFMLVGLGVLFFSERLTATKLMWLGLAFVGVLLIIQAKPDASYIGGTDYFTGVLMAFGAAFFYAVAAILAKKLSGTPPHLITLIQLCVGTVMLAPFAHLSDLPREVSTWGILVALGLVYTALMFTLQYGAIQKLPTHLTGSLYYIYPVVAIVVDFLAFGHRLHPTQLIGATAVHCGSSHEPGLVSLEATRSDSSKRRTGRIAAHAELFAIVLNVAIRFSSWVV